MLAVTPSAGAFHAIMPKSGVFRAFFFACRRHGGDDRALILPYRATKMNVSGRKIDFRRPEMATFGSFLPVSLTPSNETFVSFLPVNWHRNRFSVPYKK